MRIARVITVYIALISTFLGAETVRSKRWQEPKENLPQLKSENETDPRKITFTTSQPETYRQKASPNQHKTHSNVFVGPSKRFIKIRPGRSMSSGLREPIRFKGNRRRRQLQHSGGKTGNIGRSYELNENYIENQHIETVQGPAEAFEEGAIRIEPVYRVTKNKNIFDSIVDIIRRVIDPPKSMGPLIGPFDFPGVGDKVYIRLLEPVNSDHLVVRLISHLPATEIESTFDKNILPSSEVIEHAEIPLVDHGSLPLSNDGLIATYNHHTNVHQMSSDSALSSSNNVIKVSKPSTSFAQNSEHANRNSIEGHRMRTYKLNFKQGNVNGVQQIINHHKQNPALVAIVRNNHANPISRLATTDRVNRTQGSLHPQANGFQDSSEYMNQFYLPSANESSNENSKLLTVDFQQLQDPRNFSVPMQMVYHNPTPSFKAFSSDEFPNPQQMPNFNDQQAPSKHIFNESNEEQPKYSIQFASKNMRYLNLDGSVEPAIKKDSEERFEPMELGPIFSKVPRSADHHWKAIESSANKQSHMGLQKRNDDNGDAFLRSFRKSVDDRMNYSLGTVANKTVIRSGKQGSKCCSQEEVENKSTKTGSDEQHRSESGINNSASSVKSSTRIGSANRSLL
ncbi:PREDICTED: uncharacterized protein LOC108546048 [Eufriesea mexicana]|uniref:uncharacterized protein LOC108546048 n=1 Tax=Eufriesea mexicana TaxID=516756 RepID=UPI00083C6600|nr:PREDICTED: uncharacterized protein LOC108546048 [Eufriesea mexicana]